MAVLIVDFFEVLLRAHAKAVGAQHASIQVGEKPLELGEPFRGRSSQGARPRLGICPDALHEPLVVGPRRRSP